MSKDTEVVFKPAVNQQVAKDIVKSLLEIGAVELRPQDPFTWTSGIKSPIYCDNRLTLGYPELRGKIADQLAQIIRDHFPEVTHIAGTATAGIPHAAWIAERLGLPMVYVRSSAKGHGKQKLIEGPIAAGDRVVVIEDLISTGKSSKQAVQAVRDEGVQVDGIVAIFTYGFRQTEEALTSENVNTYTLTDYQSLIQVAASEQKVSAEDLVELKKWDPFA